MEQSEAIGWHCDLDSQFSGGAGFHSARDLTQRTIEGTDGDDAVDEE